MALLPWLPYLPGRQDHRDGCAEAFLALRGHYAAVVLKDSPAQRQTDPGTGIGVPGMQALKNLKNLLGIQVIEPNAIVGNSNKVVCDLRIVQPVNSMLTLIQLTAPDMDPRQHILLHELQRIADQI